MNNIFTKYHFYRSEQVKYDEIVMTIMKITKRTPKAQCGGQAEDEGWGE